ncbi:Hypothetical predicted protein, partial [Paramuricea clavata]
FSSDSSSDPDQDEEQRDSEDECWSDIPEDVLNHDILSPPALPDLERKKSMLHSFHSLLQWLLYFLLIWQSICHISDNGLAWLLKFLFQLLRVLNVQFSDYAIESLVAAFPTSIYMVRQYLKLDRDDFAKYVVCRKCYKCYEYGECLSEINGKHVAKRCSNKLYSRGKEHLCNSQLVKKGKLWKDFAKFKNKDFLNLPRNYGLMLNFDYFQSMKHGNDYSVGVLYLVVLNLPLGERFKWENVIVVGIIPNMDQEPKSLNEFLRPLVDELKVLWKVVCLASDFSTIPLLFRAALLCTSCDIPASRKLCGLKGHSAFSWLIWQETGLFWFSP